MVGINGIDTDMLKVIIDSGSDITLISDDALSSLSQTSCMHKGQCVNLIQITCSSTQINFSTEDGLIKVNVDAYMVKGMIAPLILGNDFDNQYSISVIHCNGESFLSFRDTGRETKVTNSMSSILEDSAGHMLKVQILPDESQKLPRPKVHRKAQKM